MIVGFSKHGKGRAGPAVKYLTSPTNPDGSARHPAPVVLRGHPAFIARLIDSLDFAHKYTSGVLSFAEGEDVVTHEMQARIMDEFERVAFAGLSREQYAILWVKHTHNPGGRVELNFLIPRCELSSGKSLNIAPPGPQSRELFDTFRSWINSTFGLADPDDVNRAQDVSLPHHIAKLKADASRKGEALKADMREAITEYVRREVDAGHITDRAGVEAYLKAQGYEIPEGGQGLPHRAGPGERGAPPPQRGTLPARGLESARAGRAAPSLRRTRPGTRRRARREAGALGFGARRL